MPFPNGFPVASPNTVTPLRFYVAATLTGNYTDNGFLFTYVKDTATVQTYSSVIVITAVGGACTFSFDGTTDHGFVPSGETRIMERREGCIAVKGTGTAHIMAWS